MYITSGFIRQYGPAARCPKCRSVARGDSTNQGPPHSRACRERIDGLVGKDPSSRDRLSRVEERKTRYFAEHLEKKFGARPDGSTPPLLPTHTHTTSVADSAKAQDVKDKTSGTSSSMVPPKCDEPGSDECDAPIAKRSRAKDTEHVPTPGQKRSSPEESCEMGTDDAGGERAARRARLALVEQMVLQLHRTPEEEEGHVSHDNPLVDPVLVILEEDWVNHKVDEENFDPKLVAVAKQCGIAKREKLKVYEIVSEKEEFERDPEAIKIGTKRIVKNKGTKTKPMIKAPLVGKESADDTKKEKLAVCRHARASCAEALSVQTCHQHVR